MRVLYKSGECTQHALSDLSPIPPDSAPMFKEWVEVRVCLDELITNERVVSCGERVESDVNKFEKNVIILVNFNYAKDFYYILLYPKNIVFISSSEGNREKN